MTSTLFPNRFPTIVKSNPTPKSELNTDRVQPTQTFGSVNSIRVV